MTFRLNNQLASSVLMIRPHRFFSNPQTAQSNKFQGKSSLSEEQLHACALKEFDALVTKLEEVGVDVILFDDTPEPPTPDSVFPNNWVSFHSDGTVVLYPMEAKNRRTERRLDIIESLKDDFGFLIKRVIDLTHHENQSRYLEGTGSMILDHINKIAYACISSRTNEMALSDFSKKMNYAVISFDARDSSDSQIYHTNVIMSLGEKIAVLCEDAIQSRADRMHVLQNLESSNYEVIKITLDQMQSFSGNVLEVISNSGEKLMLMSRSAENALTDDQHNAISKFCRIISSPIDNIEASAGGSVRCMMAEIFLPQE